jgi:predicted glycosyltransferase
MVFDDVMREGDYDLVIGDEAWEVDYYLHENPRQKRAPYVWLTDFVGVLPVDENDEREVFLTADHNAQMLEHIERYPRLRDRSIFIGDPDDIVDRTFGDGLPGIREWTHERFDFSGYVTGFEAGELDDLQALRAEFGFAEDELICIVAAGGSGVGMPLLRKAAAAFPDVKASCPELRMIVVTGPRLDPATLPNANGLETTSYVHQLHRRLAACDAAVSHGGLSTTMELTATARPFLYFPLRDHFEQNFHVHHRLQRHGSGTRMNFDQTTPEELAARLKGELQRGSSPSRVAVPTDGAARAAAMIAEVI